MAISVYVTEEQNRMWHEANVREARETVERVRTENDRRAKLAADDLQAALEWARQEGVEVD